MTKTTAGVVVAGFLAFMGFMFGWWALIGTAIFLVIGGLVGRALDGKLDLRRVLDALTGRRSSS